MVLTCGCHNFFDDLDQTRGEYKYFARAIDKKGKIARSGTYTFLFE